MYILYVLEDVSAIVQNVIDTTLKSNIVKCRHGKNKSYTIWQIQDRCEIIRRKGTEYYIAVTVFARHMYTLAKPTGRHTPGLAPGKIFGQPARAKYVYIIILLHIIKWKVIFSFYFHPTGKRRPISQIASYIQRTRK